MRYYLIKRYDIHNPMREIDYLCAGPRWSPLSIQADAMSEDEAWLLAGDWSDYYAMKGYPYRCKVEMWAE